MTVRTTPFIWWQPYRLTRKLLRPRSGTFRILDEYAEHLAGLGLDDPTKATAIRATAEHVRTAAAKDQPTGGADLHGRVADGDLSADDALKMLARRPDPAEVERLRRKRRRDGDDLVRALLRDAVLAIHEYGLRPDGGWLALLRPLAEKAIAARDQQTWNRVLLFAKWLRSPKAGVYGLAAAMADHKNDCDWWLYATGDAGRGVYLWQVEHSNSKQAVPGAPVPMANGGWRNAYAVRNTAPLPTVRDFAENAEAWGGVGLYSADEVIANQARAVAEQDRELARLEGPQPAERPRRRAAFV